MPHRDHLDEGTIHAWLDGALGDVEARDAEAHVADCASCAAAVAEARGLIAAASGILARLDAVPAGVLPRPAAVAPTLADASAPVVSIAEARRERRRGAWWRSPSLRAAAALLVVASGTLVVVRERAVEKRAEGESVVGFTVDRSPGEATRAATAASATLSAPQAPSATASPPVAAKRSVATTAPTAPPPAPSPSPSLGGAPLRERAAQAPEVMLGRGAGGAAQVGGFAETGAARRESRVARDQRIDVLPEERVANAAAAPAAAPSADLASRVEARKGAAAVAGTVRDAQSGQPTRAVLQVVSPAAPAAGSVVARAAGCYRLAFADWQPSLPGPELPGRIALRAERSAVPLVAPGDSAFVVRAEGASDAWRYAYWAPLAADSVRVVWSDGTAGAELRARLDGQTLRGSVATFSDDERRPAQRTTVTMRRARCGAP